MWLQHGNELYYRNLVRILMSAMDGTLTLACSGSIGMVTICWLQIYADL